MRRVQIRVTGDVQGVFYRYNAKIIAERLGLNGFVVNEADGSVSGIIEGDDKTVEQFVVWAKEGSPMAEVEKVEISEEEYKGEFKDFEVR